MDNRRKLKARPLHQRVPMRVEVSVSDPIEIGMTSDQNRYLQQLQEVCANALEGALDDLRLNGASEQQLGALMEAVRMQCITELWNVDLEGVLLAFLQNEGHGVNVREALAMVLMPQLGEAFDDE